MKFKFELNQKNLIRIACIVMVIALLPFSFELVFLIDIGGIDFAVTFLMLYLASTYNILMAKWNNFRSEFGGFILYLSQLYMFKPKVFVPHATASGLIVAFTCSLFLACLFWVPVMYVSSGFIA
ncbi:MAG TPA: hypothetical protein DCM64_05245 [Gammaproteobacteria bacterium]|nr:hypothetical protein [Gammaproteobacteria bacterium]MDP6734314.1 hypothetical protein [Gammaproteobacteria bacterium]HAJ75840.1 hypothetical protein [Gammaproteobacteria bacterium]